MFKRLLLIATILLSITPIANAESAYRYWGYFQAPAGSTTWTAAMTGPTVELKDGDVEGWIFTASSNDIPAAAPMMDPDFLALCADLPEVAGKIRVGLVVDFGGAEIAPTGETPLEFFADCVSLPEGSVGLDVLQAALEVRGDDSGLICGIAGYPSTECGAEIDANLLIAPAVDATPISELASEDDSSGNALALPALAVLAILAIAIAMVGWNKRSAQK